MVVIMCSKRNFQLQLESECTLVITAKNIMKLAAPMPSFFLERSSHFQ
jgi:hypothetical protein